MDREVYSVTTTSIDEVRPPTTHVKTEYVVGYDNAQRYALLQYLREMGPEQAIDHDVELPDALDSEQLWEFFEGNAKELFWGESINCFRFRVDIDRVETIYTPPVALRVFMEPWRKYIPQRS